MYLLGYDIGSSSVKAALVDADNGKTVASDFFPKTEAPIKALHAGWAEQSPLSWWSYLKDATRSVLAASGISPDEIGAIGISYQMHGLVAVDRDQNLLRDAIIWCDSRGVAYGQKACAEVGADRCMSHLLNSPGNFTATKLMWLKENEPRVFEKIYKVMLPGDYIAMKLTSEICTTVEGLSEYILWDFKDNAPADFMLDYFGFPHSLLPEIKPTFGIQGYVTPEAARELGLRASIPVTYRAGDQPNNALSLNVFNPGEIASTAGTSGVVYGINDKIEADPLSRVNCFAHVNHARPAPRIGVMACINGTGILNNWVRKNLAGGEIGYAAMNELAASVAPGSDGVTVLPFGNGAERVLGNRQIGCSFHGINFNIHTTAHIIRASQEGIVFSLMYGMEIMAEMGMKIEKIHAGKANMFLSPVFRQTLADVSGATILLFDTDGAAGAAKGAGIGIGVYHDNVEAFGSLPKEMEVTPDGDCEQVKEAYHRWRAILDAEIKTTI